MSHSLRHFYFPRHGVAEFVDSIKDGGTRVSRRLRLSYIFDHASLRQPGDLPTQRWLHSIPRKRPCHEGERPLDEKCIATASLLHLLLRFQGDNQREGALQDVDDQHQARCLLRTILNSFAASREDGFEIVVYCDTAVMRRGGVPVMGARSPCRFRFLPMGRMDISDLRALAQNRNAVASDVYLKALTAFDGEHEVGFFEWYCRLVQTARWWRTPSMHSVSKQFDWPGGCAVDVWLHQLEFPTLSAL